MLELLVVNTTRLPPARSRAIASAEPVIGVSPRQTTPSRSQQITASRERSSAIGSGERVLVVGVVGPHHRREAQVCARTGLIPDSQPAQPDAVVRVVVDRLEIERGAEFAVGLLESG